MRVRFSVTVEKEKYHRSHVVGRVYGVVQALSVTVAVLGNRQSVTKRLSLYAMIFSVRRSFLGQKNCHCSRIVTLTSVTVTDRACITTTTTTQILIFEIVIAAAPRVHFSYSSRVLQC